MTLLWLKRVDRSCWERFPFPELKGKLYKEKCLALCPVYNIDFVSLLISHYYLFLNGSYSFLVSQYVKNSVRKEGRVRQDSRQLKFRYIASKCSPLLYSAALGRLTTLCSQQSM